HPTLRLPQGAEVDRAAAWPGPWRSHLRSAGSAASSALPLRGLTPTSIRRQRRTERRAPGADSTKRARNDDAPGPAGPGASSTAGGSDRYELDGADGVPGEDRTSDLRVRTQRLGDGDSTRLVGQLGSPVRQEAGGQEEGRHRDVATALSSEGTYGLTGRRRSSGRECGRHRQLVAGAPETSEAGHRLVRERVRGAGRGQDEGVQLAHPVLLQRFAHPDVQDVEERCLETEDRGRAD